MPKQFMAANAQIHSGHIRGHPSVFGFLKVIIHVYGRYLWIYIMPKHSSCGHGAGCFAFSSSPKRFPKSSLLLAFVKHLWRSPMSMQNLCSMSLVTLACPDDVLSWFWDHGANHFLRGLHGCHIRIGGISFVWVPALPMTHDISGTN